MPNACCRPITATGKNATSQEMCLVACDYTAQVQLCNNDNDCQACPQYCVKGICTDLPDGGS
jgi:hypothetical protein